MTNCHDSFDVSHLPALPQLAGLAVVGTDTGVGKTVVAGAIARNLRSNGVRVEVFKPVATGCRRLAGMLVSEDAEFLSACADASLSLAEIAPLRFAAPAAPNVAARKQGAGVDVQAILDGYCRLAQAVQAPGRDGDDEPACVVVEGVGGLLCPISDDFWVIHLMKMINLPLVIVARAGLGTINHTLLTLHAARCVGLEIAGVVINGYVADAANLGDEGIVMETNPQQISLLGNVPILAIVPHDPSTSVENATLGPDTTFAVSQANWQALASLSA